MQFSADKCPSERSPTAGDIWSLLLKAQATRGGPDCSTKVDPREEEVDPREEEVDLREEEKEVDFRKEEVDPREEEKEVGPSRAASVQTNGELIRILD